MKIPVQHLPGKLVIKPNAVKTRDAGFRHSELAQHAVGKFGFTEALRDDLIGWHIANVMSVKSDSFRCVVQNAGNGAHKRRFASFVWAVNDVETVRIQTQQ